MLNWPSCGLANFGIGDPLDAEGHVLRRQLLAVMERHVVAERELDLGVRQILPGRGDLRDDLALVVARDEVVEDVAIDVVAVRVPLHVRVQRRRLVDQIDRQLLLCQQRAGRNRQAQPQNNSR